MDLDRLLITPFKYKKVPPPMSAYSLQVTSAIRHVDFSKHEYGNHVLVLTNSGMIQAFKSHEDPRQAPTEWFTLR
jgi:hypothetical protein